MSGGVVTGGASTERPVEVVHLLVSPVHRMAGRPTDGLAQLPPAAGPEGRAEVDVVAGRGIRGDRYFGVAAHRSAAVTLLDADALAAVAAELGVSSLDPLATRRNVVLRGVDVAALQGVVFTLDCGAGPVRLRGGRPAHPCAWMDVVLAPGAHRALRGRGGLRCEPLTSGVLRVGPALLTLGADTAGVEPA